MLCGCDLYVGVDWCVEGCDVVVLEYCVVLLLVLCVCVV